MHGAVKVIATILINDIQNLSWEDRVIQTSQIKRKFGVVIDPQLPDAVIISKINNGRVNATVSI